MGKAVFRVELAEEAHSECLETSERRPTRVFAKLKSTEGGDREASCVQYFPPQM